MDSISRWICTAIQDAYQKLGNDPDLQKSYHIKAHEVRAVATSLLNLEGYNLQDIMNAGGWASGGTFCRFYNRDLIPQTPQLSKVGSFVAAGKVINAPTSS